MKMGWDIKALGEILTLERGGSPRPIEKYLTSAPDGINWIKISDATASDKFIYTTKEKISKEGLSKTRIVNSGDFILSNSMSFGRPYIMKTTGCIHDGWLVLKQDKQKYFDVEFLYYLLSSPMVFNQFNSKAAGSTVRNLNIALVSSVTVPIPSLPEQKRIVAILDEAFSAIAKAKGNAEQNLKNAKELFESYLQSVFENKGDDWEEKTLGELAIFRNGMNFTKSSKGETVKIIGVKDFQNDFWVPFESLESVVLDKNLSEIDTAMEGDIFAVRSNGNPQLIGRTLLAGSSTDKVTYSGFTIRIRLNSNELNPVYLCNFLKLPKTRKALVDGGNGVGIKSLNQGSLSALSISFPKSKKKQSDIVERLNNLSSEIKRLELIYQQKISDLEELKKTILQKAFNGELNLDRVAV